MLEFVIFIITFEISLLLFSASDLGNQLLAVFLASSMVLKWSRLQNKNIRGRGVQRDFKLDFTCEGISPHNVCRNSRNLLRVLAVAVPLV